MHLTNCPIDSSPLLCLTHLLNLLFKPIVPTPPTIADVVLKFCFFSRWLYGCLCLKGAPFIPSFFWICRFWALAYGFDFCVLWNGKIWFVCFVEWVTVFSNLQRIKPTSFFLCNNKLFTHSVQGSLLGILLFVEYQKKFKLERIRWSLWLHYLRRVMLIELYNQFDSYKNEWWRVRFSVQNLLDACVTVNKKVLLPLIRMKCHQDTGMLLAMINPI